MTNKFETPELDKLEDIPSPSQDPNITDEKFKLGFRTSRIIATEEQADVIEKMTGAKSEPYPQPLWEHHWPSFATALCEKLAKGHLEYGDGSFERSPRELLGEIREELLDVCGWAFIMLVRLEALENRELTRMNEAIDNE